jgi:hypothetical protein
MSNREGQFLIDDSEGSTISPLLIRSTSLVLKALDLLEIKKGIFSCDIVLKPKLPGIDPIVIHAIDKHKVFDVNAVYSAC